VALLIRFLSAHCFLAAKLIFRLEAADSLRFDFVFFGFVAYRHSALASSN
jgi:hypothetical protein